MRGCVRAGADLSRPSAPQSAPIWGTLVLMNVLIVQEQPRTATLVGVEGDVGYRRHKLGDERMGTVRGAGDRFVP